MQKWPLNKCLGVLFLFFFIGIAPLCAQTNDASIDRIQLVTQQIALLKNRYQQAKEETKRLSQEEDLTASLYSIDKLGKNWLDRAALDVAVAKSNLESITIELSDSQQSINWLEKNIQEIENQLNVLSIFGSKITHKEIGNVKQYKADLDYQKKLLELEKERVAYLQNLQNIAHSYLGTKQERYNQMAALFKSRNMIHFKQQQVKDELAYQEQQNNWLKKVNQLYSQLGKLKPSLDRQTYTKLERDIFYANEMASYAYLQSLFARYSDQIEQVKFALLKTNSINILNEISNQVQTLSKQLTRLDQVLSGREDILNKHISYLTQKKNQDPDFKNYLQNLTNLQNRYVLSKATLVKLTENLNDFRRSLDSALQNELSARQGFPTFGVKTMLELGKELLLVPALTFQMIKSLSNFLFHTLQSANWLTFSTLLLIEFFLFSIFIFIRRQIMRLLAMPSQWREQLNTKWLSLQWLARNSFDLLIIGNLLGLLYYLDVPLQNLRLVSYIALVWLTVKSILTISRICLVETTHDNTGHDVKLHQRLKWIILIGGITTAMTVFVHHLPLVYELKTLFDHLFLLLLMVVSLLLLVYRQVIPNLILSTMDSQHPYLQRSVKLLGTLIPILLLGNAVVGLFGFVNLILTVSWYEGIFIFVLIIYLIMRGFLTDGMEQLSRVMIQYVNNGWLWTEAFLKPLDKVLRITLVLVACAVLFLIYGWDKQSPIVNRLTGLLHYQLINILNTTITPINILELLVVISIFYWTAKWTREFVYRLLLSRTQDMGIRNSIAILSQYSVIGLGGFICLRVLGIDLRALAFVFGMFAFGIGWGLRDLMNNFACGFLILLERPLRIGDIVNISNVEGEVIHIGSRAVTVRTWDHMELVVPNTEIFNKAFTNWTAHDNIVRTVIRIKISRYDNPHQVKVIIQNILANHNEILKDPLSEVYLKEMTDYVMEFELRYYVNIRQVHSRVSVMSSVLMTIWDTFAQHGIKPPYPQHEIFLKNEPHLAFGKTLGKLD